MIQALGMLDPVIGVKEETSDWLEECKQSLDKCNSPKSEYSYTPKTTN